MAWIMAGWHGIERVGIMKTQHAFPDEVHDGMTLRQWYAGQALIGEIIATLPTNNRESCALASLCFRIADAMIEAEAKDERH
jgi:hypothetical protein